MTASALGIRDFVGFAHPSYLSLLSVQRCGTLVIEVAMNDIKGLSPGQHLKLKRLDEQSNAQQSTLAAMLLRGDVAGPQVQSLHRAIEEARGDAGKVDFIDTNLSFLQMMASRQRDMLKTMLRG
jgi:hypothetical protein